METEVITNPSFLQALLTSPTTYIVALIIGVAIYEIKKRKSSLEVNKVAKPKAVVKKTTKKS